MKKREFSLLPFLIILVVFITTTAFSCEYNDYIKDNSNLKTLQEKTFKTEAGKKIKINASMGDVNISSWTKDEVYIKVLGNNKAEEKLKFDFEENSGDIIVTAKKKGFFTNWFSSGIRLRFEIKVPDKFNTETHTSGGDISLIGIDGKNKLKTSGGDINLQDITGDVYVSTSGGDIIGNYVKGNITLKTSGGDIKTSNVTGNLVAQTSGGDITFSASYAKIEASTSGGNISGSYSGKNLGISVSSSGGDILLKLPKDFNASARLTTSGGYVNCELNLTNVEKKTNSKIIADINGGGPNLRASTSGGDIDVLKKL